MSKLTSDNRVLEYELNQSYSNIFCFSTTRYGGVSSGNYSSFNCNEYCGDKAEDIIRNRKILIKLLPQKPDLLVFPHQNHGTEILSVDKSFLDKGNDEQKIRLEGVDALVTDINNICLCISTADCIPILLFDPHKRVAAAIHAGWRGTVNHIVSKCVSYMVDMYGCDTSEMKACIGPGISLESFEVGNEVYNKFSDMGFDMNRISQKDISQGKWHIDLPKANQLELLKSGVDICNIECSDICTYKNNDMFFSARRQGIDSGRILSGIMLLSDD